MPSPHWTRSIRIRPATINRTRAVRAHVLSRPVAPRTRRSRSTEPSNRQLIPDRTISRRPPRRYLEFAEAGGRSSLGSHGTEADQPLPRPTIASPGDRLPVEAVQRRTPGSGDGTLPAATTMQRLRVRSADAPLTTRSPQQRRMLDRLVVNLVARRPLDAMRFVLVHRSTYVNIESIVQLERDLTATSTCSPSRSRRGQPHLSCAAKVARPATLDLPKNEVTDYADSYRIRSAKSVSAHAGASGPKGAAGLQGHLVARFSAASCSVLIGVGP